MFLGETPNSSALPDSRSCPSQKHFSSSPDIDCSIGSYHSSSSLKTLYPPWQKWSLDFCLGSRAWWQISISLKKRSVGRGKQGERKATEGLSNLVHSNVAATPPSPLPQPTMGHHNLGACGGQAWPSGQLAWTGDKLRRLQGQLHGQLRAAK